jgi:RNA polymerase sigma-70 factor (ECF subfamily)
MILRMKHMEGMDIAEIAELAGISHDAIHQNLSRARRAILEQFKNRKNG